MLIITYEYLYLTKDRRLITEFFKAKAKNPSCESIRRKVKSTIKEVCERGDFFVSGHFLPSEICGEENKKAVV